MLRCGLVGSLNIATTCLESALRVIAMLDQIFSGVMEGGMTQQKTALVYGGSGFIGTPIVGALARQGWRVRVASRNVTAARGARVFGEVGQVATFRAPLQDEARVRAVLQGVDLVVNCVGTFTESGPQGFDAVQRDGAIRLARLASDAGVSDFIHISTLAADPHSASGYARSKAEAEVGILSYMPQATILRPSLVFGPDDQFFNRFAAMARLSPVLPIIGSGETKFQPVHVGDLVSAVMAALGSDAAKGQIYAIGGAGVYSFKELMAFTITAIRRRRSLIHVPETLASFMAMLTGWLPGAPLASDQLLLLKVDTIVEEGMKTLADLGIQAQSIETIVPSYLEQYRPGGRFEIEYRQA